MSERESQHDVLQNWKRNFNIALWGTTIHQRGLVVPCRNQWGTQALGLPCFLALLLMVAWTALSRDDFMWGWIAFWFLCFLKRRREAVRLAKTGQVDSRYDGWPFDAVRYGVSEKTAKMLIEPILVGILGGIFYWIYGQIGKSPTGLPYFLLSGVVTLPFVEWVKQAAQQKRLQDMVDAQLENERTLQDFRDLYRR